MHALHYANELLVRIRLWKSFANYSLNMPKQHKLKKKGWEKSVEVYSLLIRVQTTLKQFRFVFYHNVNVKESVFFQSTNGNRHCTTLWCEQGGMDSYCQQQISQSDCKISSNFGNCVHVNWLIKQMIFYCTNNLQYNIAVYLMFTWKNWSYKQWILWAWNLSNDTCMYFGSYLTHFFL